MKQAQSLVSKQDLMNMLDPGHDALEVLSEDDFDTYEDFETWRDCVCEEIYEHASDLDGKDVDAVAFFDMQEFWERMSQTKEALFFTDKTFSENVHVGCVVDNLTRSISTHHGDPVMYIMRLV